MLVCKRCGSQYEENSPEYETAQDIGSIFIESVWDINPNELCPKCRRDLGMFTILGFDA